MPAEEVTVAIFMQAHFCEFLQFNDFYCNISEASSNTDVGNIIFALSDTGFKGKVETSQKRNNMIRNGAKVTKDHQSKRPPNAERNVGEILKSFNLVPALDELQCAMCDCKAGQKNNLKTHYQLKHLGGGGLAMNCTICQQKFSTKSNLKRHMVKAHNLTLDQATKLIA